MRLLHNILLLAPCGKSQAACFAYLVELMQWQPERGGGWLVRTHARWLALLRLRNTGPTRGGRGTTDRATVTSTAAT